MTRNDDKHAEEVRKHARTNALLRVTAEGRVLIRDARLYYLLLRQQSLKTETPELVLAEQEQVMSAA